jgi:hypothetical protein
VAVTVYDDDGKTPIDWRLCLVPKSDYEKIADLSRSWGLVSLIERCIFFPQAVSQKYAADNRRTSDDQCRSWV